MKAIETSATFDEKGEMTIDNPPRILNKKVKLLFLYDDDSDTDDDFYRLAAESLSAAYSDNEPEYDISMIKEPNPLYKD